MGLADSHPIKAKLEQEVVGTLRIDAHPASGRKRCVVTPLDLNLGL